VGACEPTERSRNEEDFHFSIPCACADQQRQRDTRPGLWLDGLVVGLAVGALAAALVLEPVLTDTQGNFATVTTNLAYPVMDLLLIITTSYGAALIPPEAAEGSAALQLADQRLYLQKRGRSGDVPRQLRDVLLAASSGRHPDLGAHQHGVATLAGARGGA